jgi:hypothetical protein
VRTHILAVWQEQTTRSSGLVCHKSYSPRLPYSQIKLCSNLSSDHSPVLVTLTTHAKNREKQPSLSNRYTNSNEFRHLINEKLTRKVPLKTEENIQEAGNFFSNTIQWAGWNATPEHTDILITVDCPIQMKQKMKEKQRLRKARHRFLTPESKRLLNTGT